MSEAYQEARPTRVYEVAVTVEPPARRVSQLRGIAAAKRFICACRRIELGWSATAAAEAEGFSYRRFRQLCARPSFERRYRQAEQLRLQRRREEAEETVLAAGEKSWMARAWWLERRFPGEFALRNVQREGQAEQAPTVDRLTDAQVLEHLERERRILAQRPAGLGAPPEANGDNTPS
jgi:hypothetical protein